MTREREKTAAEDLPELPAARILTAEEEKERYRLVAKAWNKSMKEARERRKREKLEGKHKPRKDPVTRKYDW